MRVITYNIQFGMGRDGKIDLSRIIDAISEGDIIALQEVDVNWDRSGNVHQCEQIAAALPEHYFVYGANVDILKTEKRSGGRVDNARRQFGNAILSRYPILTSRNLLYPKFGASNAHAIQRGAAVDRAHLARDDEAAAERRALRSVRVVLFVPPGLLSVASQVREASVCSGPDSPWRQRRHGVAQLSW